MRAMTDKLQPQFTEILVLIQNAQNYVIATSKQELIELCWIIGKYISERSKTLALEFSIVFDVSWNQP
jgi:hypothetical protein